MTYLSSADERVARTQRLNDYIGKELVHTGSARLAGRFGGFAVLLIGAPADAQDIAAAVVEVKRAVRELKLDGIGIFSSYKGVYLGDPVFEPLMKALDELGVMVFTHPTGRHAAHPVRHRLALQRRAVPDGRGPRAPTGRDVHLG